MLGKPAQFGVFKSPRLARTVCTADLQEPSRASKQTGFMGANCPGQVYVGPTRCRQCRRSSSGGVPGPAGGGVVDIPGPSPLSCDKPPPPPHPQTLPGPRGEALTAGDPSASWDGSWVGLQPGAQEPGGAGTGTDPCFHPLLPCIPKLHPLPGAFSKSRLMLTLCLIAVFFSPSMHL